MGRRLGVHALAVLGAALGVVVLVLKVRDGSHPSSDIVLGGVAGFLFLGAGAAAHARRPDNRVGLLMVLVGVAWFAEDLRFSTVPVVYSLALLVARASTALIVHLVLAFPTGRLGSSTRRALVAVTYVVVFVVSLPEVLFFDGRGRGMNLPTNVLVVTDDWHVEHLAADVVERVGIVIAVGVLVVLVHQWVKASWPMRRVLLPVFAPGLLGAVASAVGGLFGYDSLYAQVGLLLYKVAFCLFPLGFLAGVLRLRVGRSAVDELLTRLGQPVAPAAIRDLLARALGDPSLRVGYWRPDTADFADLAGRLVPLPPSAGRAASFVKADGRPVAVLVHDQALDRQTLDAVTVAAALALERHRLAAEVRQSRASIVDAADAERRRVERDLHDGAQQRLVLTAITLREAADRLTAGADPQLARLLADGLAGIDLAVAELRDLARGVHPAVLTDLGLEPALQSLAARMPIPVDVAVAQLPRMPSRVEVTVFYVVAEALTNIVKHSRATRGTVTVRCADGLVHVEIRDNGVGGASLRDGSGLRERVRALDGELTVDSVSPGGTTVSAALPVSG